MQYRLTVFIGFFVAFGGLLSQRVVYQHRETPALQVGLLLDKGGKNDHSFNMEAYLGALKAQDELGIKLHVVELRSTADIEPSLRTFADLKMDVTIAVGSGFAEFVDRVAKDYPNASFASIDAEVKRTNVLSVLFQEHEAGYLMGVLAGLQTSTGHVGFIGGMDIPIIRRFALGYEAGVQSLLGKVYVPQDYVGTTSAAWHDPAMAKELALRQFKSGVDIIFTASGSSSLGVIDAARGARYAIGCDANQNSLSPGHVLSSALKRVDTAVFWVIQQRQKQPFTHADVRRLGVREGVIDFALDDINRPLFKPKTLPHLLRVKRALSEGTIKVPDFYNKAAAAP